MSGVGLIASERQRQVNEHGWDEDHDDEHALCQIAWAAVAYAAPRQIFRKRGEHFVDPWPWGEEYDKRHEQQVEGPLEEVATCPPEKRIRSLVKAGALVAAEIDRLIRANPPLVVEPSAEAKSVASLEAKQLDERIAQTALVLRTALEHAVERGKITPADALEAARQCEVTLSPAIQRKHDYYLETQETPAA